VPHIYFINPTQQEEQKHMRSIFFGKAEREELLRLRAEMKNDMHVSQEAIIHEMQQIQAQARSEYLGRMQQMEQTFTREIRPLQQIPSQLNELKVQVRKVEASITPTPLPVTHIDMQTSVYVCAQRARESIDVLEQAYKEWLKSHLELLQSADESSRKTRDAIGTSITHLLPSKSGVHIPQ
jgi:hypothetical protein